MPIVLESVGQRRMKLTPKQRANLPARKFGLPEKARTSDAKKEPGNLTKAEFDRINCKADEVIAAE